jgi:hypothetical protein
MFFQYLRVHLNYHRYSDNENFDKYLTSQYKQYKLDFLIKGKENDPEKIEEFLKILNSPETKLDKEIKDNLIDQMKKYYNIRFVNDNFSGDNILDIFNTVYFINDYIKYRIKLAENFLNKESIIQLKKINLSNKYINETQRENDINYVNEQFCSEFEEYKKTLEKWKIKNFSKLLVINDPYIIKKMKEIHVPHLTKLLIDCDKTPNSLDKTKYCIEIYDYVYKILKELNDLQHIDTYKRILKSILKRIPILTQNCTTQIKKVNKYGIQRIFDARDTADLSSAQVLLKPGEDYYVECINKMSMVQQLANELKI